VTMHPRREKELIIHPQAGKRHRVVVQ